MPTNQFSNPLGYFQANLDSTFTKAINTTGVFEDISPTLTNQEEYQYNTSIDARGNIKFEEKGIWKYDFVGTWNGATNDNMQLRATIFKNPYTLLLPPVKWNARGGNNWAISYSVMFQVFQAGETIQLELLNEDDTAVSQLIFGIFTAIKLY